jgi:hypothetical protein
MNGVSEARRSPNQGANDRLARVVSNEKVTRWRASSCSRASITRPAAIAALSGSKADSPRAITSALTNSFTDSIACSNSGAAVDLPAPFGPPRITTLGRVSLTSTPRLHRLGLPASSAQSWHTGGLECGRICADRIVDSQAGMMHRQQKTVQDRSDLLIRNCCRR